MMNIRKSEEGNNVILYLEGKLDTITSPDLAEEVSKCNGDFQNLIFDFEKLEVVSSAGLRVILNTHQDMKDGQKLIIRNVSELIMGIFEITGFEDILNVE